MPTAVENKKETPLIWTKELEIELKKAEQSKSMTYEEFKLKINNNLKRLKKQSLTV